MEPSRILSGGSKLDASASHAQRPPNLPDIVSFTPFPTAPLVACASLRCLVRQHPAATATSAAPKPVCNHMLYASPSRLEQLAPGQPRFVLDVSSWIHRTSKPQSDRQTIVSRVRRTIPALAGHGKRRAKLASAWISDVAKAASQPGARQSAREVAALQLGARSSR